MNDIKRVSPVVFKQTPAKTEKRNNWDVVLEYSGEKEGPYLVDLSHRPRYDLQDGNVGEKKPLGITIPDTYGASVLENGILLNRMNRTQVSMYNLFGSDEIPTDAGITDVTESTVFVAMFGKDLFAICEKLTALDFRNPDLTAPFLFQGPFSHVPCQIVTLSKDGDQSGIVLTCSRGYRRDMIHSILDAGKEFGLEPAGENRFTDWVKSI